MIIGYLKKGKVLHCICDTCGKKFERYASIFGKNNKRQFCSLKCVGKKVTNKGYYNLGKGKRVSHGYVYVTELGHPYADHRGYVLEHRLVMEKILGRLLEPYEIIHHINQNTLDNREENLMVFNSNYEHSKYHGKIWHKESARLRSIYNAKANNKFYSILGQQNLF